MHVNFCDDRRGRGARRSRFPRTARLPVPLAQQRLRHLRRLPGAAQAASAATPCATNARRSRRRASTSGCTPATRFPTRCFGPMFDIYLSTIEKLYWGRQYLTAEFFDRSCAQHFKRHICLVCAYRGDEAGRRHLQPAKGGRALRTLLGRFRRPASTCTSTSATTPRSSIASRDGIQRFEPGAGGEYKWLRGFDPALTRSMHYIAHPGLRHAIAQFPGPRTARGRGLDRRRPRAQPAQAASAKRRGAAVAARIIDLERLRWINPATSSPTNAARRTNGWPRQSCLLNLGPLGHGRRSASGADSSTEPGPFGGNLGSDSARFPCRSRLQAR